MKLFPVPYSDRLRAHIDATVTRALQEDLDDAGDISASLLPDDLVIAMRLYARDAGVLCGQAWAEATFHQLDRQVQIDWRADDGDVLRADALVARLQGPARALLAGDRVALNFLRTLSGTATCAQKYADAAGMLNIMVLDTRKTLPGLQLAQKYAVYVGGCDNHRVGGYDAYVLKRTHIKLLGGVSPAIARARDNQSSQLILVEITDYNEYRAALRAGADRMILVDCLPEDRARIMAEAGPQILEEASDKTPDALDSSDLPVLSVAGLTQNVTALRFDLVLEPQGQSTSG